MKNIFYSLLGVLILSSCGKEDLPETTYLMHQSGFGPTNGEVVIADLGGGQVKISVKLKPFVAGSYPAHLHFGSIGEVGELAYRLTDVDGATGISKTILNKVELSNGDVLTYDDLITMDGSIKVHLSSDAFKNSVLAYGNIGENDNYLSAGITTCVH